ncbi:peptidase M16 domain protein [Halothece sp. PCC 7418]|uniref:M16 family metallopeptidase n=1 Tax=Halothece sp. (strain PCC 7418) TaxID=65093 RepID=UPI0002A06BC1|nr:pitrilysin family protein [Halothece sp. PCC 7418]AFZ44614.1 peptidase M16 domain protein [Halothece sp. PCC 7418]
MKPIQWFGLALFVSLLVILGNSNLFAKAAPPEAKHYTELEFSEPPEVTLPDYEKYQLENGLTIYLIEDHEFPLVSGRAIFRTGSRFEAAEKVGLASLTGNVMRSGGTKQHSADELNQILEQRAASIETGINTTSGSANFDCLTQDLDTVFDLFAEVIQTPAFAEDKLALAKQQVKGNISRRNDDPGDIADREFKKVIYGENSPYARTPEYETLRNISRGDVIEFYNSYIRPEEALLGIVGDFDAKEMRDRVEKAFASWQVSTPKPNYNLPETEPAKTDGIYFVQQPQLSQSYVELGHLGGRLDNPDYPTLRVLNGALNGLGGILMNDVRSREGLAYSVYGVWSARYDYPGYFIAGGQTRSEATVPFIQSILDEIQKVRETPLSDDQLEYAKASILNSFIFNFQQPSQTLSRLMRYDYYGYPSDFIFEFQEGVKQTTKADVQRVAKTYLKPEKMVKMVVGNSDAINPALSQLDEQVTAVDISIPQPISSKPK